mmetsp:Transcript_49859/g.161336  ORF Transcript_49859/g.161336 Transcript_49859/m.161336 type:complete len:250 (+) Transcript_49859:74-823(+)
MSARLTSIAVAAAAVLAHSEVASVVEPGTSLELKLYDCHAEYAMWESLWTPDWKAWCCEHESRGCPSTSTATTTTRTTTTRTTTTVNATIEVEHCNQKCTFAGVTATCSARVLWASKFETKDQKNPCRAAHTKVLDECDMCGSCELKFAGCGEGDTEEEHPSEKQMVNLAKKDNETTSMVFRKRFEQRPVLDGHATAARLVLPAGLLVGFAGGIGFLVVVARGFRGRARDPKFERALVRDFELDADAHE